MTKENLHLEGIVYRYTVLEKWSQQWIPRIKDEDLKQYFINTIKTRRNNAKTLYQMPHSLRQTCLALNLNATKSQILLEKLNKPINYVLSVS